MPLQRTLLATLIAAGLLCGSATATETGSGHDHADAALASMQLERDPFAPVYIVTSRKTFDGISRIARNGVARHDSVGTALVVSEIKAHQLSEVSEHIHQHENRCGGYFAFKNRKQADAFIASDQSATIAQRSLLVAYAIDNQATVDPWLTSVSENNIYNTINHLQGYQNRYYTSTTGKTSAEWIKSTWDGLVVGRSDVSSELTVCATCSTQPSVILTVQGTDLPGEVLVIGAHLDSVNGSAGGSATQVAPGADDDASGVATVTEVIRVAMASGWKPKRTVKFMAYAGEEVGLRGSNAIAQKFKTDGVNVVGVLQLDMTNYKTGTPEDMQLVTDYSNAELKTFLNSLFDEYLAPLGMTRGTITCGYGCSDHASWTSAGFPAAMMFEAGTDAGKNTSAFTGYNPKIHTSGDTLTNMGESAAPSVPFAKLGLAFLGELGKTSTGTPPGNLPPVANFTSSTSGLTAAFTDSSTDSDGSIASRSWSFGDGTTSTATSPSKTYVAAGTYTVTLTVTDDDGASHSKSAAVTVTAPPTGNVLSNGVARTSLAGAVGSSQYFTLVVPTGAFNLKFVTSGGSGDLDLYAKLGSQPTTSSNDCKSEGSSNTETCTIAVAQAGTYHVLVKAYSAFSGATLTGSYTAGGSAQTYSNAADYAINDNATVDSPITVTGRSGNAPSNASVTVAIVHTYIGDLKVDLVAPDGSLYNIHNRTGSSTDNINRTVTRNLSTEVLNGTWKLRVNDNGNKDTGKIDSWSITF